ncbi:MAG: hypothetical protein JXB88_14980 [Spirochaetales bacterium]|nr:hypothetical protein [Spirochaetales bacterium]
MLLIIDNYDSFVYNIIHFICYPEDKIDAKRNDKIDLKEIDTKNYKAIIISPGSMGPGNVGLLNEIIKMYYKKIPILVDRIFLAYFPQVKIAIFLNFYPIFYDL